MIQELLRLKEQIEEGLEHIERNPWSWRDRMLRALGEVAWWWLDGRIRQLREERRHD